MQRDRRLFSIILPVYKRNDLAREAIISVLEQKFIDLKDLELIICDDEDDETTIKKNKVFFTNLHKDIIYVVNENEEGPGGNRQTGLDLATGKYIVFLDSDDRLKPNFISKMKLALENTKDCIAAVCLSNSNFVRGFDFLERLKLYPLLLMRDTILTWSYLFNDERLFPASFYLCQISHMMFIKDAIANQKFKFVYRHGGEDWDFFIQTLNKGDVRIVPKKLLLFRYSGESSTSKKINRERKWNSYSLLAKRIPNKYKKSIFYFLFLGYIKISRKLYEKK